MSETALRNAPSQVAPAGREKARRLGMVFVPGGTFAMGSDKHYPEEAPVHRVTVDGFWMDETPVTNAQFRAFVEATGYVTFAEIAPKAENYPGAQPHMLKAGSLVFTPPQAPVDLRNWSRWWEFRFGANWRHPYGRGSWIKGLDDHPVAASTWPIRGRATSHTRACGATASSARPPSRRFHRTATASTT
jgi:formylglycine-generating enzyme required for sulfatase activity